MTAESVSNKEFLLWILSFRLMLRALIPLAQILHQYFTSSAVLLMKLHKERAELQRVVNCIFLVRGEGIRPGHASVTTSSLLQLQTRYHCARMDVRYHGPCLGAERKSRLQSQ